MKLPFLSIHFFLFLIEFNISFVDFSSPRTELPAKHARHTTDLKSYYDYELDELKNQLNRAKMGLD